MPLYYLTKRPEEILQKRYEVARNILEISFGLNLTLPHLWKLRNIYTRNAIDNLYRVEQKKNAVRISEEAVLWFLHEEFGIPPYFEPAFRTTAQGVPYRPLNELLRRRQEEMHLI